MQRHSPLRAMTSADIANAVKEHATAARLEPLVKLVKLATLAMEAGSDGADIHGAKGCADYLALAT
jgi:2,4-dienoyl-CoA reductase-like NADH-dependent reductase (Old Yellow Enzyme family)